MSREQRCRGATRGRRPRRAVFGAVVLASAFGAPVGADTELCEDRFPEAGSLPGTAAKATGFGFITAINGRLGMVLPAADGVEIDTEDMYLVQILDPPTFLATTVLSLEGDAFDSRLWLFDACGVGLLANDQDPDQPGTNFSRLLPFSTPPDGTGAAIVQPGVYHLAISATPSQPLSPTGPIFQFDDPFEVSGPDGPGGLDPIVAWNPVDVLTTYRIELGGVLLLGVQPGPCPGDLSGDGDVSGADLGQLLSAWGPCPECPEDLDDDGDVDGADLGIMLSGWGPCPLTEGTPCGSPKAGDCFDPDGVPGCADACCCTQVCQVDPFCCDVAWDGPCVDVSGKLCDESGPVP